MHGSAYLVRLCHDVNKYCESGVVSSLVRNKHMNDYQDEPFDYEQVRQHLLEVVEDFCRTYEGGRSSGDVIRGLETVIRRHRNDKRDLKQSTVDAYLVDFLNYVAGMAGVDYGMYASDL